MSAAYRCLFIFCFILLLIPTGTEEKTSASAGNATISAEDIASIRDSLVLGMSKMALGELNSTHLGKKCVVIAYTPTGGYRPTTPPPPPGMVRVVGQTLIYDAEFDRIADDSITVCAPYPTAGIFKKIKIPRDDVQSFHLAP
jgi:hypothetical protein